MTFSSGPTFLSADAPWYSFFTTYQWEQADQKLKELWGDPSLSENLWNRLANYLSEPWHEKLLQEYLTHGSLRNLWSLEGQSLMNMISAMISAVPESIGRTVFYESIIELPWDGVLDAEEATAIVMNYLHAEIHPKALLSGLILLSIKYFTHPITTSDGCNSFRSNVVDCFA